VQRKAKIRAWLEKLYPGNVFELAPASADASFRRYFRASFADGTTRVVMDAPPSHEDCKPWLHVQALFHAAGVHVPDVLASDLEQGFLLLSDLGSTTYLAAFDADNTVALYQDAIDALVRIQAASQPNQLPPYDRALLQRELDLFPDWYIAKHLKTELSDAQRQTLAGAFEKILAVNLAEPQVYVHRDYHSRNLMVVGERNPGIIDFQDAVYGPISYDLVSLFKDAYVEWPEDLVLDWLARYWEKARKAGLPVRADFGDFYRDYEWMGVQRHIKVLGIFARLYHRDGKDGYLKDMPLVAKYLRVACGRYRELGPLLKLLDDLEGRQAQVGYTF
jgi:aminoglycoside/choline kinase family phosphotransferase